MAFGGEKMGERSAFSGIKIRVKPRIWMAVLAAVFFSCRADDRALWQRVYPILHGGCADYPFFVLFGTDFFLEKGLFSACKLIFAGHFSRDSSVPGSRQLVGDLEKQSSWDFAGSHRGCAGCGLLWGRSRDGLCRNMDL